MRTTDFSTILFEAIQFSGNDRSVITPRGFSQFRDFISARLRFAWESFDWPDLVRLQELTLNENDGDVTASLPAEAGHILNVYLSNPLKSTKTLSIPYRLFDYGNGVILNFPTDPTEAWAEYRLRPPALNGDLYSSTQFYSTGVQVYFDSGSSTGTFQPQPGKPHYGNFYTCLSNTNAGESPTTHPAKWSKVEIPYAFSNYLARAAYSDWLRSEMQADVAQVAEQEAESLLVQLIDQVTRQQRQNGRINVSRTY